MFQAVVLFTEIYFSKNTDAHRQVKHTYKTSKISIMERYWRFHFTYQKNEVI